VSLSKVGRYEILEVLGRGAMGVVYLARDPLIDRQVALKTLRLDIDPDVADEFRERFLREARAAGRLSHRNIVTIHDVGEDTDSELLFIAMEYVAGRNLKEILASGTTFRQSEVARIVASVAEAMDYAHRMGVVHRDIKPANIILTEDGTPKITDFGVARLESSNLTVEGQFIGTPNYMSPEQITGKPVDARSDIFSTGVVLYELLTGQRPFPGANITEVTHKIVHEACPIPSTARLGLPPAFNPIVLKCLAKLPEQRFQSAAELAEVLAALARSLVHRTPDDAARTAVFLPDLETRIHQVPAPPARPLQRWRAAWTRLPIPEVLRREVNTGWVWRIVGAWVIVCAALLAAITALRPSPPPPSPSAARTAALEKLGLTLRSARRALDEGRPAVALELARRVIDQAPASRSARALVAAAREALRQEQTSAATRARVTALIAEGRRLYRGERYAAAADRFQQALELQPENELAASFLDLATEHARERRPTRSTRAPVHHATAPVPRPTAMPRAGTARLTVYFNSPLTAGTLSVRADGKTMADIDFDFTRRGFLGVRRSGSGQVERVLPVPAGRHRISASLTGAEQGPLGSAGFTRDLEAGSDWTLRVDLPRGASRASFYLVQASR
jgi:predicted Ser/Thr protein kinase/tetratricopeptide (TPR) repeat protein